MSLRPGRGTPSRPTTANGGAYTGTPTSPYYTGGGGYGGGYTPPHGSTPPPGSSYGGYGGGNQNNNHQNGSSYGSYGGYTGNTGYSTPQQQNSKQRRGKSRSGSSSSGGDFLSIITSLVFWTSVMAVLGFAAALYYRSQINRALKDFRVASLRDLAMEMDEMRTASDRHNKSLRSVQDALRLANEKKAKAEKEKEDMRKKLDDLRKLYEGPEKEEELKRIAVREEAWQKQVNVLQQATIRESRRIVEEKYGNGPHQVEFAVVMPDDDTEAQFYFVVELASIDVMPHAVHLFLEQVDAGLWDNTWFYINGPHVLQAGPMADENDIREGEDDRAAALRRFTDVGLQSLAFPEYSHKFQHLPWTMGYTGRPGGPDFYINKVDNVESHGPGGQYHHELEEFADPCFAKVIKGFDVLERMTTVETVKEGEYEYFFEYPVHIVKVAILQNYVKPDTAEFNKRASGFLAYGDGQSLKQNQSSHEKDSGDPPAQPEEASQQNDQLTTEQNGQKEKLPDQPQETQEEQQQQQVEVEQQQQQQNRPQQEEAATQQQGGRTANTQSSSGARRMQHRRKYQMQKIDHQTTL